MSVPDARVADGVEDRQVLFELVYFYLDTIRNSTRALLVAERFGQFVHRSPHVADLAVDMLRIQIHEGSCKHKVTSSQY